MADRVEPLSEERVRQIVREEIAALIPGIAKGVRTSVTSALLARAAQSRRP